MRSKKKSCKFRNIICRSRWKQISSKHRRRSDTIHEESEEDKACQKIFEKIITIQMKIVGVRDLKSEQLFNLTKLGKPFKNCKFKCIVEKSFYFYFQNANKDLFVFFVKWLHF